MSKFLMIFINYLKRPDTTNCNTIFRYEKLQDYAEFIFVNKCF